MTDFAGKIATYFAILFLTRVLKHPLFVARDLWRICSLHAIDFARRVFFAFFCDLCIRDNALFLCALDFRAYLCTIFHKIMTRFVCATIFSVHSAHLCSSHLMDFSFVYFTSSSPATTCRILCDFVAYFARFLFRVGIVFFGGDDPVSLTWVFCILGYSFWRNVTSFLHKGFWIFVVDLLFSAKM